MNLLPIHLRTIAQPVVKTYFNSFLGPVYTCQDDHFPPTDSFMYAEIFLSVLDNLYNSLKMKNIHKKQTETNTNNCKYRKPNYANL